MKKPALILHKEKIRRELDYLYRSLEKIQEEVNIKEKELADVEDLIKHKGLQAEES